MLNYFFLFKGLYNDVYNKLKSIKLTIMIIYYLRIKYRFAFFSVEIIILLYNKWKFIILIVITIITFFPSVHFHQWDLLSHLYFKITQYTLIYLMLLFGYCCSQPINNDNYLIISVLFQLRGNFKIFFRLLF
jgi:hypothetical protein